MLNNTSYYIKTMFSTRQARGDRYMYVMHFEITYTLHVHIHVHTVLVIFCTWNNGVNQNKVAVTANHL